MRAVFGLVCSAALSLLPSLVCAQDRPSEDRLAQGWELSLGAGALVSPKYLGDDSYAVSTVPFVRLTHGLRFFASVQEGVGYRIVNTDSFRAGPLAQLEFGRDADGKGPFRVIGGGTNDLVGLGDIDTTLSLGGFAEVDLAGLTWSAKAGQALGGHDGLTGELGLSYRGVRRGNGPPIIYSFGPQLNFADRDYMQSYFGVTAAQSVAANLPEFSASGGLVSYGVSANAIVPLSRKTSLSLIGNYARLTGDAADAPLVRLRGDRDQVFLGIATAYTFR